MRHPLQPFDARNFDRGLIGEPGPFSFDQASYDGAGRGGSRGRERGPFLAAPLPDAEWAGTSTLDALVRFLEHPVRGFLRQRLGLTAVDEGDETDDGIPVEADGLAAVGGRGPPAGGRAWRRVEGGRCGRNGCVDELPPGALGDAVVDPIAEQVEVLVGPDRRPEGGAAEAIDVSVDLTVRDCCPAPFPVCTESGWSASSTPSSAPSTGCVPGCTCSPSSPHTPDGTGARPPSAVAGTLR